MSGQAPELPAVGRLQKEVIMKKKLLFSLPHRRIVNIYKILIVFVVIIFFGISCSSKPIHQLTVERVLPSQTEGKGAETPIEEYTSTYVYTSTNTAENTTTSTMTAQPSIYDRLVSGNYLIIQDGNTGIYYIVSTTGKEEGELNKDVKGNIALSPDNTMIAFNNMDGIRILKS